MRKLPAVSEMEHITSKEFGENMDAILERVAKENVLIGLTQPVTKSCKSPKYRTTKVLQ